MPLRAGSTVLTTERREFLVEKVSQACSNSAKGHEVRYYFDIVMIVFD